MKKYKKNIVFCCAHRESRSAEWFPSFFIVLFMRMDAKHAIAHLLFTTFRSRRTLNSTDSEFRNILCIFFLFGFYFMTFHYVTHFYGLHLMKKVNPFHFVNIVQAIWFACKWLQTALHLTHCVSRFNLALIGFSFGFGRFVMQFFAISCLLCEC